MRNKLPSPKIHGPLLEGDGGNPAHYLDVSRVNRESDLSQLPLGDARLRLCL
ncbi:hypothetical protein scyTo_0027982, partial [Scyliorhinus torazame]|nr:hypothetical protein [Scyliorhinus torazame]